VHNMLCCANMGNDWLDEEGIIYDL
jgi:hypothetical protein